MENGSDKKIIKNSTTSLNSDASSSKNNSFSSDGGSGLSSNNSNTSNSNSWGEAYKNAINNYGSNQKEYLDNLYSELKNSSYKTLLNNRISSAIAKEQALKNTNVALKANGYGSQGVANSNYAKMNNAYINALSNANSSYNDQISSYNQQYASSMSELEQSKDEKLMEYYKNQADYETTENDNVWNNEVLSSLSALTDDSKKMEYLSSLGYTTTDENGNTVIGGEKYNSLSEAKKEQLNSAMYNLDESSNENNSTDASGISTSDGKNTFYGGNEIGLLGINGVDIAYDSKGNSTNKFWGYSNVHNIFKNSVYTFNDNIVKTTHIATGTIVKLEGDYSVAPGKSTKYSIYGVWDGTKLVQLKDAVYNWNKTSDDYKIIVDSNGNITRGDKTR